MFGSDAVTDAITAADAAYDRVLTMLEAGQDRAALANIRTAVTLYRNLASDDAATYLPDLAFALITLSDLSATAGDGPTATDAAREAAALFGQLSQDASDDAPLFRPYLGAALAAVAARLHEAGDDDAALMTAQEALTLLDGLDSDDQRRHATAISRAHGLVDALINGSSP